MLLLEQHVAAREVVLTLKGALCAPDRGRFERAVRTAARKGYRQLLLDLEHVTDLDAAGIGALVAARNLLIRKGSRIRLLKPSRRLTHMLSVTGLLPVFEIVTGGTDCRETCSVSAPDPARDPAVYRGESAVDYVTSSDYD